MQVNPVTIIVQARMGSTRLPGKVLKSVLGKTLLEYLLERLQRVSRCDKIVVATTRLAADNAIAALCETLKLTCFRGPENDVLERYFLAAQIHKANTIVRITADCPLIDPQIIDSLIEFYSEHPEYQFITNSPDENKPRSYPRGMDVEIFSFKSLREAHEKAVLPAEREHVTPYFRNHPHRFKIHDLHYHRNLGDWRLTVDTPEDFELVKTILENIYPRKHNFSLDDIYETIHLNPQWLSLNHHVKQKSIE